MNPGGVRLSKVQLWWVEVMKVALPYSVGRRARSIEQEIKETYKFEFGFSIRIYSNGLDTLLLRYFVIESKESLVRMNTLSIFAFDDLEGKLQNIFGR